MLNYNIIFKECFRTAWLIMFKVYSFVTPFPNTEVLGWGVTTIANHLSRMEKTSEEQKGKEIEENFPYE